MTSSDLRLRIFLARHGQSQFNLEQRISGQANTVLSAKGLEQADALADVLRDEPLTAVYASNLTRARQTAAPTARHHRLPIRLMRELSEIGLGILEGRHVDDRDEEASRLWARRNENRKDFMVTDGEAYPDFEARVLRGLDRILASSRGAILIVGHRNTNEIILSRLLQLEPAADPELNVKNKYLYAITCGDRTNVKTIRLGGDHHGTQYPGLRT
jgi:broad specificity phosphatase PhoE